MRLDFLCGAIAAAVVAAGSVSTSAADPPQAPTATAAPAPAPSARVGRVSVASGKVQFRGPGETQWSAASVNDPVGAGVSLRTEPQARAELRIGPDTIDLDGSTEIAVARLDRLVAEIAVKQGRIDLDIRRFDDGEAVQIDMSRGGVWLRQTGRYDIDAGDGRPVAVAAFTGAARFVGGGADIPIAAGDRVVLNAAGPVTATTEPASGDEFAEWCGARAVDDAQLASPYFMSREVTGYAALDGAGTWRATDKYGEVWVPKAAPADWAPYRNGHWRWLAPWGWSWVDDQPWGFATSHYGRWRLADGQWSWLPGEWTDQPVWAPAIVAFLGTPGVGLSYADSHGPAIAWFPLGPGEIYWPSYTKDLDYIRAVNRADVVDLATVRIRADGEPPAEIANARFANREFASVVPRPVFVAGEPAATALITIPDQRLLNAPAIMGSPQIGPRPGPVRVAAAAPAGRAVETPPARTAKGAGWAGIVHTALIRSRRFQEIARLHFIRLRVAASGDMARLRHSLVLRIARVDHAAFHAEAHKRVIRR